MKVNKAQLEDVLGVSHVTLTEWQDQGLPIEVRAERKGQSHTYDTAAVIAWMIQREISKAGVEDARGRLARLQGDEIELRMAKEAKRLVPAEEIEPAWLAMVSAARSFLRVQPERLAHLLEVTEGIDAKRDLIAETFDEFLTKLSTYEPSDDDAEGLAAGGAHAPRGGQAGPAAEDLGRGLG